jgi:hypothetical protein
MMRLFQLGEMAYSGDLLDLHALQKIFGNYKLLEDIGVYAAVQCTPSSNSQNDKTKKPNYLYPSNSAIYKARGFPILSGDKFDFACYQKKMKHLLSQNSACFCVLVK